jgi:hypothetical protein
LNDVTGIQKNAEDLAANGGISQRNTINFNENESSFKIRNYVTRRKWMLFD